MNPNTETTPTASARPEAAQDTERFTLRLFRDDMGSFKHPGCRDKEDALWHINSARDHDGLRHIDMDDLEAMLSPRRGRMSDWATLEPEASR